MRATPACTKCAGEAAVVELVAQGAPRALSGPTIIVSFSGEHTSLLRSEEVDAVRKALERGDWRALFAIDLEYAPFFCAECGANYCPREWREELVWDDQDPGFLDATYGTCPNGHRRMLFD